MKLASPSEITEMEKHHDQMIDPSRDEWSLLFHGYHDNIDECKCPRCKSDLLYFYDGDPIVWCSSKKCIITKLPEAIG